MAADEKVLIEVVINNDKAIESEKNLIAEIQRKRVELNRSKKALKESGGANKEAAAEVGRYTRQIADNTKQLRIEQKEIKANDNSINGLRASVSRMTADRNNLDTSLKGNRKEFERLTASIKEQTDKLKEVEGAAGDFRRNVGDYTNSIKDALGGVDLMSGGLAGLAKNMRVLITVARAQIATLGLMRVAMIALPIMAIVVALTALVTFFTKTKRGAELLEKGLGAINAVVTKLTNDFATLGEDIFDAISDPKQALIDLGESIKENLINRLKSVSVFIEAVALAFEGEWAAAMKKGADAAIQLTLGVEEGTDKLEKFKKEIEETAVAGYNAADANIAYRKAIRDATVEAAKAEAEAEKARKLRDDERLSLEDRLKANDEVLKAEEARLNAETKIAKAKLAILQNEKTLSGKFSEEQLTEKAELNAELLRIQADFLGRTTEQLTEEVSITREAAAQKAQARIDGLNAELLALTEGSQAYVDKQTEIINAEAALQRTEAENTITNAENLNAKMLLIEAERIAALKALQDEADAAAVVRGKTKEEREKEEEERAAKRAKELAAAEKDKEIAAIEANQMAAGSAVESAETIEDAGKIVVNSIRKQIKAHISQAIAAAVAKELVESKVPFPFNIILATAAGAAASLLFDSLIPGFATGGIVGNEGVPIQRSNGDNRLATVRTGEVVVNKQQRAIIGDAVFSRAGVPGFASGGIVGASMTGSSVAAEVASTDAIIKGVSQAVANLPSPVLDYSEFTSFSSRVTLKENRASV